MERERQLGHSPTVHFLPSLPGKLVCTIKRELLERSESRIIAVSQVGVKQITTDQQSVVAIQFKIQFSQVEHLTSGYIYSCIYTKYMYFTTLKGLPPACLKYLRGR